MNYDDLIDAETWAFIRKTERFYPVETIGYTIAQQRRVYDDMCRAFAQDHPAGVMSSDEAMNGVPVRIYTKGTPQVTVIYFHGGGFVVGGLDSHDDVCAEICDQTGIRVVSCDYKLAPEFKHPAMFNDAKATAIQTLASFDGPVVLCGDSAGGNLAAAVAHALRGVTDRIIGQVLIYPALGGDTNAGSYIDHANAPMLRREDIAFYANIRTSGGAPTDDATFAPLHDSDFSNLPPTVIISAQCDPLSDDGRDYRDAILAAQGRAVWFNETGLVHGYLRARHAATRAQDSFARIVHAIAALGRADWPFDAHKNC